MEEKMRTLALTAALAGLLTATAHLGRADEAKDKEKPKDKEKQELMKRKLELSQALLASLTLNDLKKAGGQASDLIKLRKDPHWPVIKGEMYESFSTEMTRALEGVSRAAKEKNLEAAKLHYLALTLTCFNCHAYVRDRKDDA
jgi:C-terminal processing protease CtpA/Prc